MRSLVQLHGGTVTAASDGPGRGSEFTVRLPAAVGASRPHRAHPASPRPPLRDGTPRVLVVDDNEDAAELLAEALRLFGYTVDVAHDGPEALRAAAARPPDVALLDIGLPVMDGYELARRLRADPSLRAIKLVAITGYGQEADRQRAREAGFDVHLVKPVEIGALCRLLEKLRPRPEPTVEARAP